jgi:hypothetical protein
MSKWEKAAWIQIGITACASLVVIGAYPWYGIQATKLYALLALVLVTYPFIAWQRGGEILRDERDFAIERKSRSAGGVIAWTFLFASLISLSMSHDPDGVPAAYLHAIVWIQFAVFISVSAIVTLLGYRRAGNAA